jgi:RNA polymerase sigma factor (sigma-70 family)
MTRSSFSGDQSSALTPHADPERWQELVASVKPAAMLVVIGAAMSQRLREHCSPEDIWQDTLTHAWRDRMQHQWSSLPAFRAWLFEIARNRIREAARRLGSQRRGAGRAALRTAQAAPGSSDSFAAIQPADSVTPSREFARDEKRAAVAAAVAQLPPELREVVRMHLLEDLTMAAIAERLGIGLSAAWRRFRKGSEICARSLPAWARDGSGSVW